MGGRIIGAITDFYRYLICRLPSAGHEYSEVYRNKQNWIDRKYRKAYYNNKRWDFPHKYLRRRC